MTDEDKIRLVDTLPAAFGELTLQQLANAASTLHTAVDDPDELVTMLLLAQMVIRLDKISDQLSAIQQLLEKQAS